HVLPSLGETSVVQRAIGDLREATVADRRERAEVERIKGDVRMAEVLRSAVEGSVNPPAETFAAFLDGTEVRIYPERVAELVEEARAESAHYAGGRERIAMKLLRAFY